MATIAATESNDTDHFRKEAPIGTNASAPPPVTSEKPTALRRGAKAGFAKDLFAGMDMNALLDTNIEDVFEGYL